jgi:hypothetical protein
MAFKSTPSERNQAGNNEIRIYSGKPELKPVKMQMSMCLLNSACLILILVLFVTKILKRERSAIKTRVHKNHINKKGRTSMMPTFSLIITPHELHDA